MERLLHRLPIRYQYFSIVALFSICLFAVIFWISYQYSTSAIVETVTEFQKEKLFELNQRVKEQLNYVESISLAITRNTDVIEILDFESRDYAYYSLSERVTSALLGLTFSSSGIYSIHMYIKEPPSSSYPLQYFDFEVVKQQWWYESLLKNDFIWIGKQELITPNGKKAVMSFARSLSTRSGEHAGVAVINVDADQLQAIIEDDRGTSQRLLIDSSGQRIVQSHSPYLELQEQDYLKIAKVSEHMQPRDIFSQEIALTSESALVVTSQIDGTNWMIAEITPWSQLTKDSVRMLKVLGLIAVISILILLVIHLLLNRVTTKPIFLLLRSMDRYPDVVIKPAYIYRNEYGKLFDGYNALIDRIRKLYRSLEEQHKKKRETEIKALQAMINPHFLYNTLDQLNWMAIKDGNTRMSQVLEMTGGLLRIGLSDGKPLIPLSQELKFIEYYIKIQQLRLGAKNIQYSISVPEKLEQLMVPKMTLQPFIENSIKHGFHGREHGTIQVTAQIETSTNRLVLTIVDDGIGLKRAQLIGEKTKGGYGIENVRARLDAFFQADYQMELQELEMGGTKVIIGIPVIQPDNDNEGGERNVQDGYYRR